MKKKIQTWIIVAVAISIIGAVVAYSYSVEMTKQKGLQFGIDLGRIENDVRELQKKFYSEKTRWDEGDISRDELLEYYTKHLVEFKEIVSRYDDLKPPELFVSSVVLLKLSSETQIESDLQYMEWIRTGDESAKIRSDMLIQEAYEYQNLGLAEFQSAKAGIKHYADGAKFEEPKGVSSQKVTEISESMKRQCGIEFRNESGGFESDRAEVDWFNCVNEAEKWKIEHLP